MFKIAPKIPAQEHIFGGYILVFEVKKSTKHDEIYFRHIYQLVYIQNSGHDGRQSIKFSVYGLESEF